MEHWSVAVGSGDEVGLWSMFVAWSIVNSSDKVPGVYVLDTPRKVGSLQERKLWRVGRYSRVEKGVVMDNQ